MGNFYDTVGFSTTYIVMGITVLVFASVSIFTLANSKKQALKIEKEKIGQTNTI